MFAGLCSYLDTQLGNGPFLSSPKLLSKCLSLWLWNSVNFFKASTTEGKSPILLVSDFRKGSDPLMGSPDNNIRPSKKFSILTNSVNRLKVNHNYMCKIPSPLPHNNIIPGGYYHHPWQILFSRCRS